MNNTIQERLGKGLSDWTITGVGIVDRYNYLVVADWAHEPKSGKKFETKSGEKYWTAMLKIDIKNEVIDRKVIHGGLTNVHLDGGRTDTNLEAFFSSSNGITYHIDYRKDTFEHEELLGRTMNMGANDVRLLGNHFYVLDSGNDLYRRDSAKKWTLISKEPVEYFKKLSSGENAQSFSTYNEKEIYFCGDGGNLWWYDGKKWTKIFDVLPKDKEFEYIECCGDGKVYVVDSTGGVAVGRHDKFHYYPIKTNIGEVIFDVTHFNGKLYMTDYNIYEFQNDHWVKAKIPGVYGRVEHLAAKDGVMFIGTTYSLKIYNGKNTFTLYGEAKEDAMLVTKALLETSGELLEKGHDLLDEMAGEKK